MEIDDEKAAEYMEQLKRLPMVEPFPARDGWNVHEATRLARRSHLASEKSAEFRQLSSLAVQCFPGDQPHEKIERLYHLFVAVSPEAESYLSTLSEEWDDREELLALGPMLLELSSDSLLSNSIDFQLKLVWLYLNLKLGEVARRFDESQQTQIYLLGSEILLLQNDSAESYFQKSHAIAERLAHAEPNRAYFQPDPFASYPEQLDFLRALAILEALKKDGRLLPTDESRLAKLRELVRDRKPSNNPS